MSDTTPTSEEVRAARELLDRAERPALRTRMSDTTPTSEEVRAARELLDRVERPALPAPTDSSSTPQSDDERAIQARCEADYYCPGCGRAFAYPGECVGRSLELPHPPIQTVPTSELAGDPGKHTPAPASE